MGRLEGRLRRITKLEQRLGISPSATRYLLIVMDAGQVLDPLTRHTLGALMKHDLVGI